MLVSRAASFWHAGEEQPWQWPRGLTVVAINISQRGVLGYVEADGGSVAVVHKLIMPSMAWLSVIAAASILIRVKRYLAKCERHHRMCSVRKSSVFARPQDYATRLLWSYWRDSASFILSTRIAERAIMHCKPSETKPAECVKPEMAFRQRKSMKRVHAVVTFVSFLLKHFLSSPNWRRRFK